jgi:hypothetical protein
MGAREIRMDCFRTGIEALVVELFAELDDLVFVAVNDAGRGDKGPA